MLTEKHIEIASRAALQVFKGDVAKVLEFFAGPKSDTNKRTFSELSAEDQAAYRAKWETFLAKRFPSPSESLRAYAEWRYRGNLSNEQLAEKAYFLQHGNIDDFNFPQLKGDFEQLKWDKDFDKFLDVLVKDPENKKGFDKSDLLEAINLPAAENAFKGVVADYKFPLKVGIAIMAVVGPTSKGVMRVTERLESHFRDLNIDESPANKRSRAEEPVAGETAEQIYERASDEYAFVLQSFAIMLHKDTLRTDDQFDIIAENTGLVEGTLLFPHFAAWKEYFQASKNRASEFFKTVGLPQFSYQEIMFKRLEGEDADYTEAIEHAIWEWEFIPQIRQKILRAITGNPEAQGREYDTRGSVNKIAEGVVIAFLAKHPEMKDLEEFDDDTREDTMSMWDVQKYLYLLRYEIGKDDKQVVRDVINAIDAGPDMTIEIFIEYVIDFDKKNQRERYRSSAVLPSREEMERVYRALRGSSESFKTAVNDTFNLLKVDGWLQENTAIYSANRTARTTTEYLILLELTGDGLLHNPTSPLSEPDPIAQGAIFAVISKYAQWKIGLNGPLSPDIPHLTAIKKRADQARERGVQSGQLNETELIKQLAGIVQRLGAGAVRQHLSAFSENDIETAIAVAETAPPIEITDASQAIINEVLEAQASQPMDADLFGESLEEGDSSDGSKMGSASEQELLDSAVPRRASNVPMDTQKNKSSKKDKKNKSSKKNKKKGKRSKKEKGESSKKTKRSSSSEPAKPPKKIYKVATGELNAFMVMLGNEIVDNAAVPQKIAQALNLARALNLLPGDVADTKRIRTARAAARELKGADIVLPTPEEQKQFYRAIRQKSKEGDYNRYLELSIKKKYANAAWPFVYRDVTGEEFERKISTFGDMDVLFGDEKPDEDPLAKNVINAHFGQTSGKHSGPDGDWISLKPLQQQQQRPPGQQQRPRVGAPRSQNPYYPYALMFLHELSVVGTTRGAIFDAVNSGLAGTDFVAGSLTPDTFADYRKYVVADLNSDVINFPPFKYQTRVYNALRGHALDDTTIYRAKIVQAVKEYELVEAGRGELLKQITGDDVEITQSEISGDVDNKGRDIVAYTIVGLHLSKAFPTVKGPTFVALVEELKQEAVKKLKSVAPRRRPVAVDYSVVDLTGSDPGTITNNEAADKFVQKFAYMLKPMTTIEKKFVLVISNMMKLKKLNIGGTPLTLKRLEGFIKELPPGFTEMPEFEDQIKFHHGLTDADNYEELFAKYLNSLEGSAQEKKEIFELTGHSSERHAFRDTPVDVEKKYEDDIAESAVAGYYFAYVQSKRTD
jgi:hypothetical protein